MRLALEPSFSYPPTSFLECRAHGRWSGVALESIGRLGVISRSIRLGNFLVF